MCHVCRARITMHLDPSGRRRDFPVNHGLFGRNTVATFCAKCGALLAESATFCGSCGTRKQVPNQPAVPSMTAPQGVASAPPGPGKSNTLLKVGIALVVVIAIGGVLALAAAMYAAHKVSEKAHAVTRQVLGDDKPSAAGGLASM